MTRPVCGQQAATADCQQLLIKYKVAAQRPCIGSPSFFLVPQFSVKTTLCNFRTSSQTTVDKMFGKGSNSGSSSSGSGSGSGGYTYTSSGTNDQGNHYCSRDYGSSASNSNSYHYSNNDGSYYYSNPNGSTYYNSGSGYSQYTPPGGK